MNVEVSSNNEKDRESIVSLEKPWVVLRHGAESTQWITYGPYSTEEVKLGLKSGEIKPTDHCWMSGWTDWKRIYLEPEFYLARKPPIEIKTVKKDLLAPAKKAHEEMSNFAELAHNVEPDQYKGSKYKKGIKSDLVKTSNFSRESQVSKDGELNMLEPWEDKTTKKLDFVEDKNLVPQVDLTNTANATAENYVPEDFDKKPEAEVRAPRKFKSLKAFLLLCMAGIIALASYRLYTIVSEENAISYSLSYFVVEDYINELPQYMYARTDLKRGNEIKIRLYDLSGKQIRTRNKKAGLMLTSQGTGRMRLPMYAYTLKPGVYNLVIEVDDQRIEKEFTYLPEG